MSNVDKWRDLFGAEWEYVVKLGSCFSDPEQKREFWEAVREKKMADQNYSIYSDFPRSVCATKKAMHECCDFVAGLRRPKEEEAS